MTGPRRWAVLVSGRGSNLARLLRVERRGGLAPARIVGVAADRRCPALAVAARYGVPAVFWPHRGDGPAWERRLLPWLASLGADGIVLAGFLRKLGPAVLSAYPGRVLNLHPSLLPLLPGLEAPRRALEAGLRVTGVTVHFADEGLDQGPILMQAAVRIDPDDNLETLTRRLHRAEHRLLPKAVAALSRGEAALEDGRVVWRKTAPSGEGDS